MIPPIPDPLGISSVDLRSIQASYAQGELFYLFIVCVFCGVMVCLLPRFLSGVVAGHVVYLYHLHCLCITFSIFAQVG